jgi:hypothetical protein
MNNYKILTSFQNLVPLENYSYEIESIDGNWPVTAFPISGSFVPMGTKYDINTNIKFCVSSGLCDGPNLLEYNTETCNHDTVPFAEFRVKLNLPYSNLKIYSDTKKVECDDCLKAHKISSLSINALNNEVINISGSVTGLSIARNYSYSISSLGGNYPLAIEKNSGSFVAQSDKQELFTNIGFCCPSGSCSGTIFPKTYSSLKNKDILEHNILLSVIDDCTDILQTKEIKISQNKVNPNFIVPNNITLTKNSNGCSKLDFSLTNLVKDHSYLYTYKLKDANWPVYIENISGVVYGADGNYNIGSNIAFCSSSGLCSGLTILGDKKPNNTKIDNYCFNSKYISLYVEVIPDCYPEEVVFSSDPVTVYCNDCLDSPSISLS